MLYREITNQKISTARYGEKVVSRGQIHVLRDLPGYIAENQEGIQGVLFYHIVNVDCEIVVLESNIENMGIGSKLIEMVKEKALALHCKRIWLITTNDNIRAIRFYQRRGFDMKCLHYNAVEAARLIKPAIPLIGEDGIPIRHEIEFELIPACSS